MAEERVQRKLAAILAADVVGYSRLMETDEEGTLARMKMLRKDVIDPRIAEYSGVISSVVSGRSFVQPGPTRYSYSRSCPAFHASGWSFSKRSAKCSLTSGWASSSCH